MLVFGGGALSVPGVHGAGLALAKAVDAVKDGWKRFWRSAKARFPLSSLTPHTKTAS